jgi:hypothetical protein
MFVLVVFTTVLLLLFMLSLLFLPFLNELLAKTLLLFSPMATFFIVFTDSQCFSQFLAFFDFGFGQLVDLV